MLGPAPLKAAGPFAYPKSMTIATNGHRPRTKAKDITAGLDDGSEVARLMKEHYQQLVEHAFLDAADHGIDIVFDLEMTEVQDVLDRLATKVRSVAETTKEEIRAAVGTAAENGWGAEQLKQRILEMAEINSKSRAVMIARTELAQAHTLGSKAAWAASGVVDRMQWLIGPDPCPECAALADKIVGVDEEFADGIDGPPYHPNCTCAVSPVVSE